MTNRMVKQKLTEEINHKTVYAFGCTFFWGILTHAYGFLHSSFLHDGLNAVYIEDTERIWKLAIGRVFVNLYRSLVRGDWALPWLIGIISLFFIAIAVRLIVEVFHIDTIPGVVLLSCVMVVNPTITSLVATYIFEMDIDMLALLMAVMAVYFWTQRGKYWILGIPCICISLGLYQAYLSVTVTLMLLYLLKQVLDDEKVEKCVILGTTGCTQICAGGILYIVCLIAIKFIWRIDVTTTESYNGLNVIKNNFLFSNNDLNLNGKLMEVLLSLNRRIRLWTQSYWADARIMPILDGILLIFLITGCVKTFSRLKKREKIFAIILVLILPLGMNLAFMLSGVSHSLMEYALVFGYLLLYILYNSNEKKMKHWSPHISLALFILFFVVQWNGIVTANQTYLQRDLQDKSRLSYMTRILARLEEEPGFRESAEYIAVIGESQGMKSGSEKENFLYNNMPLYYQYDTFRAYCKYIINYDVEYCDPEKIRELSANPIVQALPSYPDDGCVTIIDGIYLIKVAEI